MQTEREKQKQKRQERKKQGLCPDCGNKRAEGKSRCQQCLDKRNGRYKKRTLNGLCVDCGNKVAEGKSRCQQCLDKITISRKERITNGLCRSCVNKSVVGKTYCQACCDKINANSKQRTMDGMCHCGRKTVAGKIKCVKCMFIRKCKFVEQSPQSMIDLFNQQKGICPYSGRKLTLGDASIDHKIPRAKGGANDLSNLQWVHLDINYAKSDLLHDDFIQLIKDCYEWQTKECSEQMNKRPPSVCIIGIV